MICPKCSSKLDIPRSRGDLFYYECRGCHGQWVRGHELRDFCSTFWSSGEEKVFNHFMNSPIKKTSICCPDCKSTNLMLTDVKGIEVEFCLNCHGVFFDVGELVNAMPNGKHILSGIDENNKDKLDIADFLIGGDGIGF